MNLARLRAGSTGSPATRHTPRHLAAAAAGLSLVLTGALAGPAAATTSERPVGNFDAAEPKPDGIRVAGWAADRDGSATVMVDVTVDGVRQTVRADQPRPDVARAFPEFGGYRGWDVTVPVAAGTHTVCAVAQDIGGDRDRDWGCRTVTVAGTSTVAPAPSGSTTPSASNTGVPDGTALRVHHGDLTITTPGTVVDGVDVRGFLRVKARNVTVKNSVIRGKDGLTGYMSLVQSSDPLANLLIQDSTLVAAHPSPYVDGIVGKGFTLRRVEIRGVVDQVKITGDNVLVEDSWLHSNLHYSNDPNYGGTPTHDDNVQVQRGSNITFRNNVLEDSHNAAVMITQDAGDVGGITFSGNRISGGACSMNVAEKGYGPINNLRITDNVFGLDTRHARCAILMPDTTASRSTVENNVFTDGKPVSISRG